MNEKPPAPSPSRGLEDELRMPCPAGHLGHVNIDCAVCIARIRRAVVGEPMGQPKTCPHDFEPLIEARSIVPKDSAVYTICPACAQVLQTERFVGEPTEHVPPGPTTVATPSPAAPGLRRDRGQEKGSTNQQESEEKVVDVEACLGALWAISITSTNDVERIRAFARGTLDRHAPELYHSELPSCTCVDTGVPRSGAEAHEAECYYARPRIPDDALDRLEATVAQVGYERERIENATMDMRALVERAEQAAGRLDRAASEASCAAINIGRAR